MVVCQSVANCIVKVGGLPVDISAAKVPKQVIRITWR